MSETAFWRREEFDHRARRAALDEHDANEHDKEVGGNGHGNRAADDQYTRDILFLQGEIGGDAYAAVVLEPHQAALMRHVSERFDTDTTVALRVGRAIYQGYGVPPSEEALSRLEAFLPAMVQEQEAALNGNGHGRQWYEHHLSARAYGMLRNWRPAKAPNTETCQEEDEASLAEYLTDRVLLRA